VTTPLYARLVGKLLAREERGVRPPSPADRAAAIGAIERALEARARKRRRQRMMAVLAVAAAAALVAGGVARRTWHPERVVATAPATTATAAPIDSAVVGYPVMGAASVVSAGTPAPLADRRNLPTGSRVVTPSGGRVMLAFATGTDVLLGEAADMTIVGEGATQVLRLDQGSLDLHVTKLDADQRFLLQTPDAEIEVRGTAFRAFLVPPDAACGDGTPTRVVVTDGVVVVRRAGQSWRVEAGQPWPAGCPTIAAHPASKPTSSHGVSAGPASSLGEQNDLFSDAMAAKRRGDASEALGDFDRFVARYPGSPLAESATVERMRLLRASDPARAAGAARQYLARFPNGFARAEAEAILAGAP